MRTVFMTVALLFASNMALATQGRYESAPGTAQGILSEYNLRLGNSAQCVVYVQNFGSKAVISLQVIQDNMEYDVGGTSIDANWDLPADKPLKDGTILRKSRTENDGGSPHCYLGVCGAGTTSYLSDVIYKTQADGSGQIWMQEKSDTKYVVLLAPSHSISQKTLNLNVSPDLKTIKTIQFESQTTENGTDLQPTSITCTNLMLEK